MKIQCLQRENDSLRLVAFVALQWLHTDCSIAIKISVGSVIVLVGEIGHLIAR